MLCKFLATFVIRREHLSGNFCHLHQLLILVATNLVPRALLPACFGGGTPHLQSQEKRPEDEVEGQRDGIFYKQLKGITKSYNTVNVMYSLKKNQFQLFNVIESIN